MKDKIIIENENDIDWCELWTKKMDKKVIVAKIGIKLQRNIVKEQAKTITPNN